MFKLVLSDMDNTLVAFGHDTASTRTIEAIHACLREGITFGPATGRNPLEVADFLCHDKASYETGIMVTGQQVFLNGTVIREVGIAHESLERAIDVLRGRHGCALITYRSDGTADWIGANREELEPIFHEATRQGEYRCDALPTYPVIKVGIIARLERAEERSLQLELIEACPDLDFLNTVHCWFDVVPRGLSKADGIEVLRRAMGISLDEICVFGDADNDLAMFARVPNSCAVANATEAAGAAARWHIGESNEDGVAIALEQIAVAARLSRTTGVEVLPEFMR